MRSTLDADGTDIAMPKKRRPEEKPEKQFERFVETARQLDIDDTDRIARDFKRIASSGHRKAGGSAAPKRKKTE